MSLTRLPDRPAYARAYLMRTGQGEIVVRRKGQFVERWYFQDDHRDEQYAAAMADAAATLERHGFQPRRLRCEGCNRAGCSGALDECPARWV